MAGVKVELEAGRTLTEGDIRALADALDERFAARFYLNLGKGVWALAWKGIVVLMLALAASQYFKGH
jgi:hypothetical protein